MKNPRLLMPIIIAISAISPQAYAENPKPKQSFCEQQLRTIALVKFKISGINPAKLQAELGDNEGNNQPIRIFVQNKTGANSGATFGWLRLDKNTFRIYDITNDDLHPKLLKVNQKQVQKFVNQCLQ